MKYNIALAPTVHSAIPISISIAMFLDSYIEIEDWDGFSSDLFSVLSCLCRINAILNAILFYTIKIFVASGAPVN